MKNKAKIHPDFYKHLVKVFLVLLATCSFVLGLLWVVLDYYESTTPDGALIHYTDLIAKGEYDEIYEESKKVFAQFNPAEDYIEYLKSVYEGVDVKKAGFIKSLYNTDTFTYYDMVIDGDKIANLEIRKDDKKNKWNVRTLTNSRSIKIDSPVNDVKSVINGNVINSDYITDSNIPSLAYENLHDPSIAPRVYQYFVDNLVVIPEVEVANQNYIIVKDAILDQYYAGPKVDEETLAIYEEVMIKAATTYCMYITEDTSFNNLRKLLYTKSNFYDAIRTFDNAFFSEHDKIEFENMKTFDILQLGEEGFIGSISFDFIVTAGSRTKTYTSTYQMTFLKQNNKWLMTNLVIAEE